MASSLTPGEDHKIVEGFRIETQHTLYPLYFMAPLLGGSSSWDTVDRINRARKPKLSGRGLPCLPILR